MGKNAESFIKKTLGEDFIKSLSTDLFKSEVYKQGTHSVTDTDDLFQGLQIVPRVLLSLLSYELSPMQIDEVKEIKIPGKEDTMVRVQKLERDSYSGQVFQNNVKINDFINRSLPGLGLVLMTVLELYDFEDLDKKSAVSNDKELEIKKAVEERFRLHTLVNQVVDGKLSQRDAIQKLLMDQLTEELVNEKKKNEKITDIRKIAETSLPKNGPVVQKEYLRGMANGLEVASCIVNDKEPNFIGEHKTVSLMPKNKSPLSDFIERRKKKKEHFIKMEKSETISCSDCGQEIFSDGAYSGCICFGDSKKLHVKKSEGGYSVKFGRGWDIENIQMLLEVLRGRKNG